MYAQYAKIHHKRKGENSTRIRRWLDAFGNKSVQNFIVGDHPISS